MADRRTDRRCDRAALTDQGVARAFIVRVLREGRVFPMNSDLTISRRRFLQSLAAVGVVVACGPTAAPTPSASSSASAAAATAKPVSIEWWRRNYTPGSQTAETITSDAAVKGWRERNPNFTITIQGGPFGPETDQKFDIAILQAKAGPDEFFAAAKKLTFKRANGKQAYGFAHANDEFAFMLIDGGRLYDKDVKTWTFNSADAVSGLEKWVALAQAKVMPPDFLTLNPNDSQARFLSGDIAILQRPSAMINVLNADKNWEFGKNWDIANFPKAKGDQTAWGGVGFIAVREQQDADKKAAAHQFAKYLTGPDIGPDLKKQTPPVEYWLAPAGRTSAAGIYGDYHPAKAKVAKMGAFTYVLPNVSTWSEIDQKYMRPARDAALEGKKTPEQALDEVAPQAQKLLDEANK